MNFCTPKLLFHLKLAGKCYGPVLPLMGDGVQKIVVHNDWIIMFWGFAHRRFVQKHRENRQTFVPVMLTLHGLTGLPVEAMAGKGASRRKRSRKPKTNSKITLTGRQYIGKYLLKFFRKSVTYQTPAGWYKGTVLHVRDINNELRFQTAYFTGRGQYLEEVSFEVLEQAMKYWEAARHEWKGTAHVQLHYNLIFCINYNILCVCMCHRSDG